MTTDRFTVRLVVVTLAVVVVGALVSEVGLTWAHMTIPAAIAHAFDIGLGAIAGILAKTSTNEPAPVQVVNAPDAPVPVDTNLPGDA